MINMAQRIEELRGKKGVSRPAMAAELGFPKMAIEKFETGRITPTKEQQLKMAAYFGVSPAYLRGESDDPASGDNWLNGNLPKEPEPTPPPKPLRDKVVASSAADGREDSAMLAALLNNDSFRALVRAGVLEVLNSKEGQELLIRAIRKAGEK